MADAAPIDLRRRDVHVAARPVTMLESLAAELGSVDPGSVTLQVDARPGWTVTYSLGVSGPQLAGWRQACADEHMPGGVDEFLWHRTILAAQCKAISKDGQTLDDGTGRKLDYSSEVLQRLLGVPLNSPAGETSAVHRLYGLNDFAISAAADRVVNDAGFGKAAKSVDPTPGSSRS